jgi:hypothetical protein
MTNKAVIGRKEKQTVCPESTVESANRRNFIRKAATMTAATGISGALIGARGILPNSSAKTDTGPIRGCCCTICGGIAVCGYASKGTGVEGFGGDFGIVGNSYRVGVFGCGDTGVEGVGKIAVFGNASCGTGVCGSTVCGTGVSGSSLKGIAVLATAGGEFSGFPNAIPIVAKGALCQAANLQQWQKGSTVLSVVNKSGWLGIATSSPTCPLTVYGSATVSGSAYVNDGIHAYSECGTALYANSCYGTGVRGNAVTGVKGCSPYVGGYGVHGHACSNVGVFGCGASIGVLGQALTATAIPMVAQGHACQSANLQQWEKACTIKSIISSCGYLGIGTTTASTPLDVVGSSPQVGTFKSSAVSGDRSALVQFANADSTAVDWNLGVAGKCNSIKVPDGYFYVQHSTSCTPAISVNKCNNHVGIGLANPCRVLCVNGRIHTQCGMGLGTQTINTTLAINGSLSVKSRQVSSTATLTLSDYVVVANATSAEFTITLPSVSSTAGACNGMMLFIKKIDSTSNAVTIAASGTDTIEGNASVALKKQYDSLQLVSNNSGGRHEWFILAGVKCGAVYS